MRKSIETILATILVPGVAAILIPYLILRLSRHAWSWRLGLFQIVAIFVGLVGFLMVIWVSYAFVTKGGGTPIPLDPPDRFVASGLFRYVRNPMYVGALLVILSEAIGFGSLWLCVYAFLLWLALHLFLVFFEEPQLKRRFGESYRVYLLTTPRWIPRQPGDLI